jgi:hypothetical protein
MISQPQCEQMSQGLGDSDDIPEEFEVVWMDHKATLIRGWGRPGVLTRAGGFLNGRYSALAETLTWMFRSLVDAFGFNDGKMGQSNRSLPGVQHLYCSAVYNSGSSSVVHLCRKSREPLSHVTLAAYLYPTSSNSDLKRSARTKIGRSPAHLTGVCDLFRISL